MIGFVLGALVTTVFFTIGLIYKRKISDIVEKLEKKVENKEKASFFYPKSDAQAAFEEKIQENELKGKDTKVDFL